MAEGATMGRAWLLALALQPSASKAVARPCGPAVFSGCLALAGLQEPRRIDVIHLRCFPIVLSAMMEHSKQPEGWRHTQHTQLSSSTPPGSFTNSAAGAV